MECRAAIFFLLILQALNGQSDISFMRFYKNDKDFISDLRLLATDRFQRSHLQVFYDSNKNPLIKEWVNTSGDVVKKEILEAYTKLVGIEPRKRIQLRREKFSKMGMFKD